MDADTDDVTAIYIATATGDAADTDDDVVVA